MKKINKLDEPNRLGVFRSTHPNALWERDKSSTAEAFRCCIARYQETLQQLRTDQGNLCAYCEQDLMSGTDGVLDDCRIEHFHPKSKREQGEPNWALEWGNLLVVCCGGNQSNVVNSEQRFDTDQKNYSCDVPKSDKILDGIILNPLNLPELNLWKFDRSSGQISVNEDSCLELGISVGMAHQTIKELNLNSPRLTRFRKTVLDNINDQITKMLKNGQTVEQAVSFIARSLLRKNGSGDWPSFFSTIRSYLGQQAELVLGDV
ncbi:TPA: retron system putative HNH endonuclease [Providencia alcalifaciens]|uniref:retron system putative HNH endonuclease n=1 Tax=Providencia alcalifaciens TaxID=126385 RepID=UPI0012B59048|nr:retron system putative HNH endonuclease [Providencia alcalifaciens]MTC32722.1 TIGR02646 family protein [Providencia alcalifaciens]